MCAISSKVFEISPQTIQDPVKSNYDMVHFFQLFTTEIPWLVHDGKDVIFREFKFWFAIILCLSLLHYINGLTQGYGILNALAKENVMKCWVLDLFCPDRGQTGPRSETMNEWVTNASDTGAWIKWGSIAWSGRWQSQHATIGPEELSHQRGWGMGTVYKFQNWSTLIYRNISNISHTKSKNLSDCCLVLQLPLANPLKPAVKLRMKM